MIRLSKPNRSSVLLAALAGGLMLAAAPALADDDDGWRRHHHPHHGHGGKQVFYDGPCKVERKWGHGGYKEEVKCHAPRHAYYPAPVVAYYPPPPPPPPPVYVGPPTISVVIPLGR
jgi:hypothetical protein